MHMLMFAKLKKGWRHDVLGNAKDDIQTTKQPI